MVPVVAGIISGESHDGTFQGSFLHGFGELRRTSSDLPGAVGRRAGRALPRHPPGPGLRLRHRTAHGAVGRAFRTGGRYRRQRRADRQGAGSRAGRVSRGPGRGQRTGGGQRRPGDGRPGRPLAGPAALLRGSPACGPCGRHSGPGYLWRIACRRPHGTAGPALLPPGRRPLLACRAAPRGGGLPQSAVPLRGASPAGPGHRGGLDPGRTAGLCRYLVGG
ncbi:Uncharacterised protein [Klebsiella pneumoniae]|nr:Uncharacterised protein [Klebsiella pneumoniae]